MVLRSFLGLSTSAAVSTRASSNPAAAALQVHWLLEAWKPKRSGERSAHKPRRPPHWSCSRWFRGYNPKVCRRLCGRYKLFSLGCPMSTATECVCTMQGGLLYSNPNVQEQEPNLVSALADNWYTETGTTSSGCRYKLHHCSNTNYLSHDGREYNLGGYARLAWYFARSWDYPPAPPSPPAPPLHGTWP